MYALYARGGTGFDITGMDQKGPDETRCGGICQTGWMSRTGLYNLCYSISHRIEKYIIDL